MLFSKRENYCWEWDDGDVECHRDGWWDSEKGVIAKWCILAALVLFFVAWFVGGRIHAKKRMRKGLPLLGYHRFLVSYNDRRRAGQLPQNHFTFYNAQQPYGQPAYGSHPEAPPMYNGNNDAPPSYYAPPSGAAKMYPASTQAAPQYPMTTQPTGPYPSEPQQSGLVGTGSQQDVEGQDQTQHQSPPLPERPQQAKTAFTNLVSRFRR